MKTTTDYILYILAFTVIISGAYGLYDAVKTPSSDVVKMRSSDTWRDGAGSSEDYSLSAGKIMRIVVMGTDDRDEDTGRSDTLMVIYVNPSRYRLAIMSIPRDLRVRIPGHGYDKINAAYASGGPERTVNTVEDFLNKPIDHWIKIDFEGFVRAVDTLGGVDITVPDIEGPQTGGVHRGMNYDDNWGNLHIHLKPGRQHLDGEEALGFVRYRKSNLYRNRQGKTYRAGINDIKRAENQQMFLRELMKQKLRLAKLPALIKAGSQLLQYVKTDPDLTWTRAYGLFKVVRNVNPSSIYTMTVPIRDRWVQNGDTEMYYAELVRSTYRDRMSELHDYLHGRQRIAVPVRVLNGCGRAGIAASAADILSEQGFENVEIGNADRFDYQSTEIAFSGDAEDAAHRIAELIACGELGQTSPASEESSVKVIVGEDFSP